MINRFVPFERPNQDVYKDSYGRSMNNVKGFRTKNVIAKSQRSV